MRPEEGQDKGPKSIGSTSSKAGGVGAATTVDRGEFKRLIDQQQNKTDIKGFGSQNLADLQSRATQGGRFRGMHTYQSPSIENQALEKKPPVKKPTATQGKYKQFEEGTSTTRGRI